MTNHPNRLTASTYVLKSWNNSNPETITGLNRARTAAEIRAKREGSLVKMSADGDPGFDFFYFQTVTAAGEWSKWQTEALPGSLSALDEDEG